MELLTDLLIINQAFGLMNGVPSDVDALVLPDIDSRLKNRRSRCYRWMTRFMRWL